MDLSDTAPRSAGFIFSYSEGHEMSEDELIGVGANEVKSPLQPAREAERFVQKECVVKIFRFYHR